MKRLRAVLFLLCLAGIATTLSSCGKAGGEMAAELVVEREAAAALASRESGVLSAKAFPGEKAPVLPGRLGGEVRPALPGEHYPESRLILPESPSVRPGQFGLGSPQIPEQFLPPQLRGSIEIPGGGPRDVFGRPLYRGPGMYGPRDAFGRPLYGEPDLYGPRDVFGRPMYGSRVVIAGNVPVQTVPRAPTAAESRAALGKFARDLGQVEAMAGKKDWGNLGRLVHGDLQQAGLPAELRQSIAGVESEGRLLQQLTGLDEQLAAGKAPRLSEADLKNLPPSVGKAVDDLDRAVRLKAALGEEWPQNPDVARLQKDLATYAAVTRDETETARLARALADKAARSGDTRAARELLRDLERTGPAGPGSPGAGNSPSSGAFVGPVPEAPGGASAAPRQSAREGLPPLEEEVKATASQARQRATEQVRDQIEVTSHRLHLALHLIQDYRRRADQLSREKDGDGKNEPGADEKPEEAVARALKRPLTPQDRILLQGMQHKGMKTPAIVAKFRELEATADK
jgi:hypothetical protein